MSAYLSSNDTISALATYWSIVHDRGGSTTRTALARAIAFARAASGSGFDFAWAEQKAQKLIEVAGSPAAACFHILLNENVHSLKTRYPGDDTMWEGAKSYAFRSSSSVLRWIIYKPYGHGHLVSLANGYSYQSCESDGWLASIAYQLIQQIKEQLLKELERRDTEDSGSWADFVEPEDQPQLVALSSF